MIRLDMLQEFREQELVDVGMCGRLYCFWTEDFLRFP